MFQFPMRSVTITSKLMSYLVLDRSMTGYVFLVYEDERSVKKLISECYADEDRFYLLVSSPTMRKKPVQVRPWRLIDMDYILKPKLFLDPRRTIFIGMFVKF